jgi:hypothetical protein
MWLFYVEIKRGGWVVVSRCFGFTGGFEVNGFRG